MKNLCTKFMAVLCLLTTSISAQDVIRNAPDHSDEDYKQFKKTLIDRPAWNQLQADFLEWKQDYPLRHTDSPAIHLVEGEPIISLFVPTDDPPEVIENRNAGVTRICKLIFKNKRFDKVHISYIDKETPEQTHSRTISKKEFLGLFQTLDKADKLLPSKRQSIRERSQMFEALTQESKENGAAKR